VNFGGETFKSGVAGTDVGGEIADDGREAPEDRR
jgi:hypothetical protein